MTGTRLGMRNRYSEGQVINNLTLKQFSHKDGHGNRYWFITCHCGVEFVTHITRVGKGHTKSCGCTSYNVHKKHGMKGTPTYRSWYSMKQRCLYPKAINYNNYGGRGITLDERWHNFSNFLEDMGIRPEGCSLDRVNSDGPYTKENCRWATRFQQQNNTRNNHILTYAGKTKTLAEWSKELGVKETLINDRLDSGWTTEEALTTPVRSWKHKDNEATGTSTDGRYGK